MTIAADYDDWLITEKVVDGYEAHAKKVAQPCPREPQYWPDLLLDFSDAYAWANDLRAEADEWEIRAMAEATESLTVARAQGVCATYIRWAKALKRLAESADRRTSVLQTLLKQRP